LFTKVYAVWAWTGPILPITVAETSSITDANSKILFLFKQFHSGRNYRRVLPVYRI